MAIYYAKVGLTGGTGTGTKADPWPLNDMFPAGANPKALATGDVLGVQTDGSTVETLTSYFGPSVGDLLICPVDMNGDVEDTFRPFIMDASGLGAVTAGVLLSNASMVVAGAEIRNVSGRGFQGGALSDECFLIGCRSIDPSGTGFEVIAGAEALGLLSCYSEGAGAFGYRLTETVEQSFMRGCVDVDSNNGNSIITGQVEDFLVVMDTAINNTLGIALGGGTRGALLNRATVHMRGTGTGWKGVSVNDAIDKCTIIDSLVKGNNATSSVAYELNGHENLFWGNYYHNVVTAVTGAPSGPGYHAPTLQDPDFVNAASGDYTPQNAMTTVAFKKIFNEGADWRDAGVIPTQSGGGGGGGGMIVHPGMSGGMRG